MDDKNTIKDFFGDLKTTFNERIKNPFIASFILSWLASNWLIIYKLCTFAERYSYDERVDILINYVHNHKWDKLTLTPLWHSIVIAACYIICSVVFNLMFNFYNSTLKAIINKWTKPEDNVTKEEHDYLNKQYDILRNEVNQLRRVKAASKEEVDKIKQELETERGRTKGAQDGYANVNRSLEKTKEEYEFFKVAYNKMKAEYDSVAILNGKIEGELRNTFIPSRAYIITFDKKLGDAKVSGDYQHLPKALRSNPTVRIDKLKVISTIDGDILFNIEGLKTTDDGFLVVFDLVENSNIEEKVRIYLFREGQMSHTGFCVCKGQILFVKFKIKEQKANIPM